MAKYLDVAHTMPFTGYCIGRLHRSPTPVSRSTRSASNRSSGIICVDFVGASSSAAPSLPALSRVERSRCVCVCAHSHNRGLDLINGEVRCSADCSFSHSEVDGWFNDVYTPLPIGPSSQIDFDDDKHLTDTTTKLMAFFHEILHALLVAIHNSAPCISHVHAEKLEVPPDVRMAYVQRAARFEPEGGLFDCTRDQAGEQNGGVVVVGWVPMSTAPSPVSAGSTSCW